MASLVQLVNSIDPAQLRQQRITIQRLAEVLTQQQPELTALTELLDSLSEVLHNDFAKETNITGDDIVLWEKNHNSITLNLSTESWVKRVDYVLPEPAPALTKSDSSRLSFGVSDPYLGWMGNVVESPRIRPAYELNLVDFW